MASRVQKTQACRVLLAAVVLSALIVVRGDDSWSASSSVAGSSTAADTLSSTPSASASPSTTPSVAGSTSASGTLSQSQESTMSQTPAPSPSASPSPSSTPSSSGAASATSSFTASMTASPSPPTGSVSATAAASSSASASPPSLSASPSSSPTLTPSASSAPLSSSPSLAPASGSASPSTSSTPSPSKPSFSTSPTASPSGSGPTWELSGGATIDATQTALSFDGSDFMVTSSVVRGTRSNETFTLSFSALTSIVYGLWAVLQSETDTSLLFFLQLGNGTLFYATNSSFSGDLPAFATFSDNDRIDIVSNTLSGTVSVLKQGVSTLALQHDLALGPTKAYFWNGNRLGDGPYTLSNVAWYSTGGGSASATPSVEGTQSATPTPASRSSSATASCSSSGAATPSQSPSPSVVAASTPSSSSTLTPSSVVTSSPSPTKPSPAASPSASPSGSGPSWVLSSGATVDATQTAITFPSGVGIAISYIARGTRPNETVVLEFQAPLAAGRLWVQVKSPSTSGYTMIIVQAGELFVTSSSMSGPERIGSYADNDVIAISYNVLLGETTISSTSAVSGSTSTVLHTSTNAIGPVNAEFKNLFTGSGYTVMGVTFFSRGGGSASASTAPTPSMTVSQSLPSGTPSPSGSSTASSSASASPSAVSPAASLSVFPSASPSPTATSSPSPSKPSFSTSPTASPSGSGPIWELSDNATVDVTQTAITFPLRAGMAVSRIERGTRTNETVVLTFKAPRAADVLFVQLYPTRAYGYFILMVQAGALFVDESSKSLTQAESSLGTYADTDSLTVSHNVLSGSTTITKTVTTSTSTVLYSTTILMGPVVARFENYGGHYTITDVSFFSIGGGSATASPSPTTSATASQTPPSKTPSVTASISGSASVTASSSPSASLSASGSASASAPPGQPCWSTYGSVSCTGGDLSADCGTAVPEVGPVVVEAVPAAEGVKKVVSRARALKTASDGAVVSSSGGAFRTLAACQANCSSDYACAGVQYNSASGVCSKKCASGWVYQRLNSSSASFSFCAMQPQRLEAMQLAQLPSTAAACFPAPSYKAITRAGSFLDQTRACASLGARWHLASLVDDGTASDIIRMGCGGELSAASNYWIGLYDPYRTRPLNAISTSYQDWAWESGVSNAYILSLQANQTYRFLPDNWGTGEACVGVTRGYLNDGPCTDLLPACCQSIPIVASISATATPSASVTASVSSTTSVSRTVFTSPSVSGSRSRFSTPSPTSTAGARYAVPPGDLVTVDDSSGGGAPLPRHGVTLWFGRSPAGAPSSAAISSAGCDAASPGSSERSFLPLQEGAAAPATLQLRITLAGAYDTETAAPVSLAAAPAWLSKYVASGITSSCNFSHAHLPGGFIDRFVFGPLALVSATPVDAAAAATTSAAFLPRISAGGGLLLTLALPVSLPWSVNRSIAVDAYAAAAGALSCALTLPTFVLGAASAAPVLGFPTPSKQAVLALDALPVFVRPGILPLFSDTFYVLTHAEVVDGAVWGIDAASADWINDLAAPALLPPERTNATDIAGWAGSVVPAGSNTSALLARVLAASTAFSFAALGQASTQEYTTMTLAVPANRGASFLPPGGLTNDGNATHPSLSMLFGGLRLPVLISADGGTITFVTPPFHILCGGPAPNVSNASVSADGAAAPAAAKVVEKGGSLVKTLEACPPPILLLSYAYPSSGGGASTASTILAQSISSGICNASALEDLFALPSLAAEGSVACPPACGDTLIPAMYATSTAISAAAAPPPALASRRALEQQHGRLLAASSAGASSAASSGSSAAAAEILRLGTGVTSVVGSSLVAVSVENASSRVAQALFSSTGNLYVKPCPQGDPALLLACASSSAAANLSCFWGQASDCTSCTEGAVCPGGYRQWAQPGFYVPGETSLDVPASCPFPSSQRCTGWDTKTGTTSCGEGYAPNRANCLTCDDGFYSDFSTGGECLKCPAKVSSSVYVASSVGIIFGVIFSLTIVLSGFMHALGVRAKRALPIAVTFSRALAFLGLIYGTSQMLVQVVRQANPATTARAVRPFMAIILLLQFEGTGPVPVGCTDLPTLQSPASLMAAGFISAGVWALGVLSSHILCPASRGALARAVATLGGLGAQVNDALYAMILNAALSVVMCQSRSVALWQYQTLDNDGSTAAAALGISAAAAQNTTNAKLLSTVFAVPLMNSNPLIICYESYHRPYGKLGLATLAVVLFLKPFVAYLVKTRLTIPLLLRSMRLPRAFVREGLKHVSYDGLLLQERLSAVAQPYVAKAVEKGEGAAVSSAGGESAQPEVEEEEEEEEEEDAVQGGEPTAAEEMGHADATNDDAEWGLGGEEVVVVEDAERDLTLDDDVARPAAATDGIDYGDGVLGATGGSWREGGEGEPVRVDAGEEGEAGADAEQLTLEAGDEHVRFEGVDGEAGVDSAEPLEVDVDETAAAAAEEERQEGVHDTSAPPPPPAQQKKPPAAPKKPIPWPAPLSELRELDVLESIRRLERERDGTCCRRPARRSVEGATPAPADAAPPLSPSPHASSADLHEEGIEATGDDATGPSGPPPSAPAAAAAPTAADAVAASILATPTEVHLDKGCHFWGSKRKAYRFDIPKTPIVLGLGFVPPSSAPPLKSPKGRRPFAFAAPPFVEIPQLGCLAMCVRRYNTALNASEIFVDSSLALRPDLFKECHVLPPEGYATFAYTAMKPYIGNGFRLSQGAYQLLKTYLIVVLGAATNASRNNEVGAGGQGFYWYLIAAANTALSTVTAVGIFYHAPLVAANMWLQPIVAFTLLLTALAQANSVVGYMAVGPWAVFGAKSFSVVIGILCLLLPIICVVSFLAPAFAAGFQIYPSFESLVAAAAAAKPPSKLDRANSSEKGVVVVKAGDDAPAEGDENDENGGDGGALRHRRGCCRCARRRRAHPSHGAESDPELGAAAEGGGDTEDEDEEADLRRCGGCCSCTRRRTAPQHSLGDNHAINDPEHSTGDDHAALDGRKDSMTPTSSRNASAQSMPRPASEQGGITLAHGGQHRLARTQVRVQMQ